MFPSGVVAAQLRGGATPEFLLPDERLQVANAVPKRVREFAAGRLCARAALAELGVFNHPLTSNSNRGPKWPDSIVGSIAHSQNICVAVVGRKSHFRGLGIDVENVGALPISVERLICTVDEHEDLERCAPEVRAIRTTVLFSAKEAFFKCQNPVTAEWLDFLDASVSFDSHPDRPGTLTVTVKNSILSRKLGAFAQTRGCYAVVDGVVTTAIAVTQ
jgi:4'-phosphopantetheinyl transferase EntD